MQTQSRFWSTSKLATLAGGIVAVVALAIFFHFGPTPPANGPVDEAHGRRGAFAKARPITLDGQNETVVPGRLDGANAVECFWLQMPRTGKLTLQVDGDGRLNLYDVDELPAGRHTGLRSIAVSVMAGEVYFVKMAPPLVPAGKAVGDYHLRLALQDDDPKGPPDFSGARDGTNSLAGKLESGAVHDVMWIRALRDGLMVVTLKPGPDSNLAAHVAAYDHRRVAISAPGPLTEFAAIAGNLYYLRVTPVSSSKLGAQPFGSYVLDVQTEDIDPDDYGDDVASAHAVELDEMTRTAECTGRIEMPNDRDCFAVRATGNGTLEVDAQGAVKVEFSQGEQWTRRQSFQVREGERCFVRVSGAPATAEKPRLTGPYALLFKFTRGERTRPKIAKLIELKPPLPAGGVQMRNGKLEVANEAIFYQVKAPITGDLRVTLQPSAGSKFRGQLEVFDLENRKLGEAGTENKQVVQVQVQAGFLYLVKIAAQEGADALASVDSHSIEFRSLRGKPK